MVSRHQKNCLAIQFWTILLPDELLVELGKTVTPEKARVQKSLKNLDSPCRRNDEKGFLQETLLTGDSVSGMRIAFGLVSCKAKYIDFTTVSTVLSRSVRERN